MNQLAAAALGVVVAVNRCCVPETDPPSSASNLPSSNTNLDFTQPYAPDGVTISRAGATTVYAQTSATAAAPKTGAIYENRGSSIAGWWVFPSIPANLVTSPFDHSHAAWLRQGSPTVTAANVVAPDGTMTGDRIAKTSINSQEYIYQGASTPGSDTYMHSTWVRTDSPAPNAAGGLHSSLFYQQRGAGFDGLGSSWRRVSTWHDNDDHHGLIPAGWKPWNANGTVGGFDTSKTGAINVWGDYYAKTLIDYPLVVAASGAQTIQCSAAQAAAIVSGGDFAVHGSFIAQMGTDGIKAAPGNVYIFSAETPEGLLALRFDTNFQWILTVRGVDQLSGGAGVVMGGWPGGYEVGFDAWYLISTGKWGLRISVNGCAGIEISGNTTGSALQTPTSLWLGSNLGTNSMSGMWTKWRTTHSEAHGKLVGEFVLVGDSIIERVINQTLTGGGIYSIAEGRTRQGITTLAHSGDTVANQLTAYNASTVKGSSAVKAFYIKVGINDIFTNRTDTQIIADYTALFNAIRAGNPSADIVTSTMLPAKTFDVGMTANQYAYWQSVNAWIVANSLGADCVETDAGVQLNDGADGLKPQYTTDYIHPLNSARLGIVAPAIRAAFSALGHI